VKIEDKVTCLVGKNESGKTAFLQALDRLNPARLSPKFSIPDHYPAWLEKRHRLDGKDLDQVTPIEVQLEWQPDDVAAVEAKFGPGVATVGSTLTLWKAYDNKFRWINSCSESQAVTNFLGRTPLPASEGPAYAALKDFEALEKKLAEDAAKNKEVADALAQFTNAQAALKTLFGKSNGFGSALWAIAVERVPEFFYFAEYSKLPYTVKIQHVLKGDTSSPRVRLRPGHC
jgi:hypothetical protein